MKPSKKTENVSVCSKYFSVAGPHLVEPSPQRTPFIFQAGASSAGKTFATKHAEVMFVPGWETGVVRKNVDDIRERVRQHGRDPRGIKIIAAVLVVVDETDEKARAKYEDYASYADLEGSLALFAGWTGEDLSKIGDDDDIKFSSLGPVQSVIETWSATVPGSDGVKWTKNRVARELAVGGPHAKLIGSPTTVADNLQQWVTEADVDGFNLLYAISPGSFKDIIRYLLPELRRRGVFWDDYRAPGGTARENYLGDDKGPHLRNDHPGAQYKWPAPAED